MHVRTADPSLDALRCAEIYTPYVVDSVISFEYEAPSIEEVRRRMADSIMWLVAEENGEVTGYAYTTRHRDRSAYQWSADVAVYVGPGAHRRGIGTALYQALIERARGLGLRQLCAGVTQPNESSNRFHEAMGFEPVGTYRRIGWKFGGWHDVRWYQLDLMPGDESPPSPWSR